MNDVPTILLVDNTPDTLALLGDLLESEGYNVVYAEDGDSAIQRTLSLTPDLILLDIRMPELDGFATCRALKSFVALRDVPVLCMSTYSDRHVLQKAFDVGGTDFVSKTIFDGTKLLPKITSHLSRRSFNRINLRALA